MERKWKLLLVLILLYLPYLLRSENLCFRHDRQSSFCQGQEQQVLCLDPKQSILARIASIQKVIRQYVDADQNRSHILLAEGFDATLVAIAENNLLPFYRQRIKGLVLSSSYSNLYKSCLIEKSVEANSTCESIRAFGKEIAETASIEELFTALSPALQWDKKTPKTILMGLDDKERKAWQTALDGIQVDYRILSPSQSLNLGKEYPPKPDCKVPVKEKNPPTAPHYNGALLRYHLWKIAYAARANVVHKKEISYGKDPLQTYDLFYEENNQSNPLFIYIHGGGWKHGDKQSYYPLCEQYANRGFTAISINYRLLDLPRVGMREMVADVRLALSQILKKATAYHADASRVLISAESSGAQLAYMALLDLPYGINALFQSMPSDLSSYTVEKQIKLSGIKSEKKRQPWLEKFSPLNHLKAYHPSTLIIQGFNDKVVSAKHLEALEIQAIVEHHNIHSLWINHAQHPISPTKHALQPSYQQITKKIDSFIESNL